MEGCSSTDGEAFNHYKCSATQNCKKYHVFLSAGVDIRKSLVDHLFQSLSTAGFDVFLCNEESEKGKNIEVSLGEAVRNSRVYIPLFSADYAKSARCLDELSLIWTYKSTGTTIIPLFYNVEPSDVRYPDKKGPYAELFQKHREGDKSEKEMDAWKEALHQVSLLSGWSLATTGGHEGKLVKQIVTDLVKILKINSLYVAKHTEGLPGRMEEVTRLLEINNHSGHVLGVGIWGMGGLGKTTLAKAVYNNIHSKFEASCFLSDVRASTKESVKGLLKFQKQILRDLVKVDESNLKKLQSVDSGKAEMEDRLRFIKALVILDDVDDEEQLEALIGDSVNGYWFGAGSRIIVTTRDSQVLARQTHVIQHRMRSLDPKEGLRLFSWHAFMRTGPAEGYKDITEKIVDACQGLPLSLEVVGAYLYGEKSFEIWREALKNLGLFNFWMHDHLKDLGREIVKEESPNNPANRSRLWCHEDLASVTAQTQGMPNVEGLVLDFLNHHQRDCSTYPWALMPNLKFMIIRGPHQPGRTNLPPNLLLLDLQDCEFVEDESAQEDGSASERKFDFCLPKAIGQLKFLRFLQVHKPYTWIGHLPNEVGELLNLEELYLSRLSLKELPQSLGNLIKLKVLDVSNNESLTKIPSLNSLHSLEDLKLNGCEQLQESPALSDSIRYLSLMGCENLQEVSSISHLKKLEVLDVSECYNLTKLPSLDSMHSIKELKLEGCKKLQELPAIPDNFRSLNLSGCEKLQEVSSISHLKKLEVLYVSWCKSLTKLPSLDSMHSLKDLKLEGCKKLRELPALSDNIRYLSLMSCEKLQEVPSISHLKKLEVLDVSLCYSLAKLPSLDSMHSLKDLKLDYCKELQELPAIPDNFRSLSLSGCEKLQEVSSISHLKRLEVLDVSLCKSLRKLPSLDSMHSLKDLKLDGCEGLEELPALPNSLGCLSVIRCEKLQDVSSISHLKKLEVFDVSLCKSLTKLPSLDSMHSLKDLKLEGCKKLQELPALPDNFIYLSLTVYDDVYDELDDEMQEASGISHSKSLALDVSSSTSFRKLPSLDSMHSLKDLKLNGCEGLEELPALPNSLSCLILIRCEKLQDVSSISYLKKLEVFEVYQCYSLTKLPSLDSMHSLKDLKVEYCKELQELPAIPDNFRSLRLSGCKKLQEVSNISHLKKLEFLDVSWCKSLTKLPSLDSMHSLKDLKLQGCKELQELPAIPDNFRSLSLSGCEKLQEVSSISHLKKLEVLDFSKCYSLRKLPSLDSMHSLKDLKLDYCKELQELPAITDNLCSLKLSGCEKLQEVSSISHLKKLEVLDVSLCKSLTKLPSLDSMHFLRDLKLDGCEGFEELSALPNSLSCLSLIRCEKLQEASSISHLKNLEVLDVSQCYSLRKLPSLDSMGSLKYLKVDYCKELQDLLALPQYVNLSRKGVFDLYEALWYARDKGKRKNTEAGDIIALPNPKRLHVCIKEGTTVAQKYMDQEGYIEQYDYGYMEQEDQDGQG